MPKGRIPSVQTWEFLGFAGRERPPAPAQVSAGRRRGPRGRREGQALRAPRPAARRGGSREVVLGSSSALQGFLFPPAGCWLRRRLPSPFSPSLSRLGPLCGLGRLAPPGPPPARSPFPSSLRGRSRGRPGRWRRRETAAAKETQRRRGQGRAGRSPFSEARDDARGPVPAALRRGGRLAAAADAPGASNRRKILVKNLPRTAAARYGDGLRGDASQGLRRSSCRAELPLRCPRLVPGVYRAVRGGGRAELRALSVKLRARFLSPQVAPREGYVKLKQRGRRASPGHGNPERCL